MRKHSLASEAVMRAIAKNPDKNEEEWGIAGFSESVFEVFR